MAPVLILCAGLGTRLRPLTQSIPKPLVPLAHRPILHHMLDHLCQLEPSRFFINTHHLPDRIEAAIPARHWGGRSIEVRHEPDLLDTGGTVSNFIDLLNPDEDLIVCNGDIVTNFDICSLWQAHKAHEADATLLLMPDGPVKNVTITLDDGSAVGRIADLRGTTGASGRRCQFSGISVLSARFLAKLPPRGHQFSLVDAWLQALYDGRPPHALVDDSGASWADLGDRRSLLDTHQAIAAGTFRLPGTSHALPLIHPQAKISAKADVDAESWIGPGAVVEGGATIRRSVVFEYARIHSGATLEDCVAASNAQVPPALHRQRILA